MKKSIKILALILTLALVCGVFVIGAFAAEGYDYETRETVTGETIGTYWDFEKVTPTNYGSAAELQSDSATTAYSALKSNNNRSTNVVYGGRQGIAEVETSEYEDNNYFKFTQASDAVFKANQGPYIAVNYADSAGNPAGLTDAKKLSNIKYTVVDLDWAQKGDVGGNFGVDFHLREYRADGGRNFVNGGPSSTQYKGSNVIPTLTSYTSNGNTVYFNTNDGWSEKANVPTDGSWNHYTIVMETSVINDEASDRNGYIMFNMYLFINGELSIVKKDCYFYHGNGKEWYYDKDPTNLECYEIRISLGNNANDSVKYLDNIAVRTFDKSYTGNFAEILAAGKGADLTKWDANVYSPEKMPFGTLMATIENEAGTKSYDNMAKAFADVKAGDLLTIKADCEGTFTVKEAGIQIDKGGFTCELVAADGLTVHDADGDGIWVSETATSFLEVVLGECECGNGCWSTDPIMVPEHANLYAAIQAVIGEGCIYEVDGVQSTLIGWEDAAGDYEIDEEFVVTADMLDTTLELTPIYKTEIPVAVILNAAGEVDRYAYDTLIAAIGSAANGETVKLLANAEIPTASVTLQRAITIDLNGYRIISVSFGTKFSPFNVSNNVTVTSSKAGATIYSANINSATSQTGAPIFAMMSGGALTINGNDEKGNSNISMYAATIIQSWAAQPDIHVNGGSYYRTAADNQGFFHFRKSGAMTEIKNAYIESHDQWLMFNQMGAADAKVVVDNCFITNNGGMKTEFAELSVTITNSVIGGNIFTAGTTPNSLVIGEGNYLKEGVEINAAATIDAKEFKGNFVHTYTSTKNNFGAGYNATDKTAGEDSFALTSTNGSVVCDRFYGNKDAKEVEVTWYDTDGATVLATSTAPQGAKATAPAAPVAGTNGIVDAIYTDWSNGAVVAKDAEAASFTLQGTDGAVYVAADDAYIDVLFNFDMINHYQFNFYVPKNLGEGITVDSMNFTGIIAANNVKNASEKTDYDGTTYKVFNRWPGVIGTASGEVALTVNLTYTDANGNSVAISVAIDNTISMAKYVNYIITNEKYEGQPIVTAMADMMRFIDAQVTFKGATATDEFKATLAEAEVFMSEIEGVEDATADLSAIAEFVTLEFKYDLGEAMTLTATRTDAAKAAGYGVVITAKAGAAHNMNLIGETRSFDADKNTFSAHNIRTYAMADTFVVTIYEKAVYKSSTSQVLDVAQCGNVIASAEYSMAAYVAAKGESLGVNELAVVEATLAYAKSADAFMTWRDEVLR